MRCAARPIPPRGTALALAALLGLAAGCRDDEADDDAAAGSSTGDDAASGSGSAGSADETGTGGATGEMQWNSLEERPCPDDSFLTYENFGGPFMLSYCTTCHASRLPADMRQGSPIEVNFDDIEDVRAWADRIWIRAADQNLSMPPVGPPNDEERANLGEWLACGAPTAADLGM